MFVVNPLTNKPIKVFGRTYRKLLEEGLISSDSQHPDVLCCGSDMNTIQEFNKEFYHSGEPYQAVQGRGCFEGKAVIRRLPRNWPPAEEIDDDVDEVSSDCDSNDEEVDEECSDVDVCE